MKKLREALNDFQTVVSKDYYIDNGYGSNDKLESEFKKLTANFLYGGFINVNDKFHIYLTTVEFYFHCEQKGMFVYDPIVYHRNNMARKNNQILPYFPLGSINMHQSGIDITFEKKEEYRASVLGRCFEVYDTVENKLCQPEKRSTYIYNSLQSGATLLDGINIKWKDAPIESYTSDDEPFIVEKRVNVAKFKRDSKDIDWEKISIPNTNKKYIQDERIWSFTRKNNLSYDYLQRNK